MSQTEGARALARYTEACNYQGALDVEGVEGHLKEYLSALGVQREVRQLPAGWSVESEPGLRRYLGRFLEEFKKRRAALDALDARAARDARDAERRLMQWCIHRLSAWYWGHGEMSWMAAQHLGALQTRAASVLAWSKPVYEAYLSGCWLLHWTDDTLYWVRKPAVFTEEVAGRRRLHREDGPAVESDVEPLYFWHGVFVPAAVVMQPDSITVKDIIGETNTEVRRVMIERGGLEKLREVAEVVDEVRADDTTVPFGIRDGRLLRLHLPGEPLLFVDVANSTPEPDGTRRRYLMGVHPECRPLLGDGEYGPAQELTVHNAVASLYGLKGEDYGPAAEA